MQAQTSKTPKKPQGPSAESAPTSASYTDVGSLSHFGRREDGKKGQLGVDTPKKRKSREHLAESNGTAKRKSEHTLVEERKVEQNGKASHTFQSGTTSSAMDPNVANQRRRQRSPWFSSNLTIATTCVAILLGLLMVQSFFTRQREQKGCNMCWMRPAWAHFADFDSGHTRLGRKYRLFLYREGGIDEDTRVKGTPLIFIPGNAGSYAQGRPHGSEAAVYFQRALQGREHSSNITKVPFDVFALDFNEDITAFHGQTLQDQAEYLNEAIKYILSLYRNPHRALRNPNLPNPMSVILIAHSMGGIVARTTLTLPSYQPNTVNTIITLAAPHAKAPISLDGDIVELYDRTNTYWREAYAEKREDLKPLQDVTVISIAGGSLDTMVPSDYSTMASLIPLTHGFTVFTSTIPNVWVSMDHLAITWCDQLRSKVVQTLYAVMDASRSSQTLPVEERMRVFKKWFLTGMEKIQDQTSLVGAYDIRLTVDDNINSILTSDKRVILSQLGDVGTSKTHFMQIPQDYPDRKRFSLLTDQLLESTDGRALIEVLLCKILDNDSSEAVHSLLNRMNFATDASDLKEFACKSTVNDVVLLPPSRKDLSYPFNTEGRFSYLQYDVKDLTDHEVVAIVDKSEALRPGWVIAEFKNLNESVIQTGKGLHNLAFSGLDVEVGPEHPMMTEIKIPSMHSSLLAYTVDVRQGQCASVIPLFSPLMRQYISDPYESRYHVNVQRTNVSLHGISPFVPPPLHDRDHSQGLTLQLWTDPSCGSKMQVSVKLDAFGSMGKLWMRYRTMFAAFPLVVVSLVLLHQVFWNDQERIFVSFSEAMDASLRFSIPITFTLLTVIGTALSKSSQKSSLYVFSGQLEVNSEADKPAIDFSKNDLLLGSQDPFFWFLVPFFGLVSVGVCMIVHYALLGIVYAIASTVNAMTTLFSSVKSKSGENNGRGSLQRRVITMVILLLLVFTIVPYQAVFALLCVIQISSCVQALLVARESQHPKDAQFFNYAHSILVLLIWILPINLPVLVVWIRNLRVHFLAPFSHHNVLSIIPLLLLVQIISAGKSYPGNPPFLPISALFFVGIAFCAAMYGVSYAYLLHDAVNILAAWLVFVYATAVCVDFDVKLGWTFHPRRIVHLFAGNISSQQRGSIKEKS